MRILFATKRYTLKRFRGVVLELVGTGHDVIVASTVRHTRKLPPGLRKHPRVALESYELSDKPYAEAVSLLRLARNYAWYLDPGFAVASFNRRRSLDWLTRAASRKALRADPAWPDPVVAVEPAMQAQVERCIAELEAKLPPDPGILEFLRERQPDVVLVSPLVRRDTHQTEIVKAARALGIPSAYLVHSWDGLSNKGRIHFPPDRVFVWNEVQRREAVELHGIEPDHVVVAGAPHWDVFFAMTPSIGRDELCAGHGFDPAEPIVLYLGSTNEVCPDEPAVVDGWLAALRGSAGALARANVLVRRHPREQDRWLDWSPSAERVSVSREVHRTGQDLYDELHHASVVVGLNTSAQIEASILGKPVYTFSAGESAPAQGGSSHFYYLLSENGGVVTYADTLDEHVAQLERGIAGDYDREAIRRFAELFVRPRGLDRPVAPIVAEEVVALAAGGRETASLSGLAS